MAFQLLIVQGRSASDSIKLTNGVTTLGRQETCQIQVKSSQVSRRHCELYEKKGVLLVKDLGSSNGTFVNGKKIRGEKALQSGDELTIGQVSFKVEQIAGETPKRPIASADTAVVEAIALSEEAEEEFEIAFDDEPVAPLEPANPAPQPSKAQSPAPKKVASAPKKVASATEPEPQVADEAIADFLLDIKLDDED
jgi:pSer/pThr/pTyr-binding forkhead associated (FHA) protein